MPELPYRNLVWLTYRLAATFAMGIPFVLLVWSSFRREASMMRLLTIYWKVSSLLAISMLLLMDQKPIGYVTAFLAPLLMLVSVWFWVDLNEELADLPPWRPLPLTVRTWRWALSGFSVLASSISAMSLQCMRLTSGSACNAWVEAPKGLHQITEQIFRFLFGAQWTESIAAFVGYAALLAYLVGFLHWLLVRLPKHGRIAGEF